MSFSECQSSIDSRMSELAEKVDELEDLIE